MGFVKTPMLDFEGVSVVVVVEDILGDYGVGERKVWPSKQEVEM